MIPRSQQVIFFVLLIGCAVMGGYLFHLRGRTEARLHDMAADAPMIAPSTEPGRDVKLVMAADSNGHLSSVSKTLALPTSENGQARVLLVSLMAEYAKPLSQHPLSAGPSVEDVFLLPLRRVEPEAEGDEDTEKTPPQVAIVNLSRAFVDAHPSGVEPEMLTIRSIVATLHENLPAIKQVRFLVEGQERETLAGHASLMRVYDGLEDTSDPVNGSIQ